MNLSKKNDPRSWKMWAKSGAVALGNAVMTRLGRISPKGPRAATFRFLKNLSVKEVLTSMDRAGYRGATIAELSGIRASHDDGVAPPGIPYFSRENVEAKLIALPSDPWDSSYRFLLFRE